MKNDWSTTESDWQGVDDVPTIASSNLVKSGGVYEEFDKYNNVLIKNIVENTQEIVLTDDNGNEEYAKLNKNCFFVRNMVLRTSGGDKNFTKDLGNISIGSLSNGTNFNLFDLDSTDNVQGYAINTGTGIPAPNEYQGFSHKIPVSSSINTTLTLSIRTKPNNESSREVCTVESELIFKYGFNNEYLGFGHQVQINENVAYVRVQWYATRGTRKEWALVLNYGNDYTNNYKYLGYVFDKKHLPTSTKRLVIPKYGVYGLPTQRTNLFMDNITLYGDHFDTKYFNQHQDNGMVSENGILSFSPLNSGGQKSFVLFADSYYIPENYQESEIRQVPDYAFVRVPSPDNGNNTNQKVLLIGDSITQLGYISSHLLDLADTDSMKITLLGTRGTAPAFHEGRGGWSAYDYCHLQSKEGIQNAFWNPTSSVFDFSYYMQQQGYSSVDYVCINLGTNDDIDLLTNNIETMVNSIRSYSSIIKILLWLLPMPRFGDFRKNIFLKKKEQMIVSFEDRENENIYLVDVGATLDPEFGFNVSEIQISPYRKDYVDTSINDPIHPSVAGCGMIGDSIFSAIKYNL